MTRDGSDRVGRFWVPTADLPAQDGTVTFDVRNGASVLLDTPITHQSAVTRTANSVSYSGRPEDIVRDFQPVTILGELDDQTPVTILSASAVSQPFGQQFRTTRVVFGRHVVGPDQRYVSARFRIGDSSWWRHLTADGGYARLHLESGACIAVRNDSDHVWFEYTTPSARTLSSLESRVFYSVEVLAKLAYDQPVALTELEVKQDLADEWLPVWSMRASDNDGPVQRYNTLLVADDLRLTHIGRWLNKADVLMPLPPVLAMWRTQSTNMSIQTRLLVLSVVAEGLHDRVFETRRRFPTVAKSTLRRIRRRLSRAASFEVDTLGVERSEELSKSVSDALSDLDNMTYAERIKDIGQRAERSVPGVVGISVERWASTVKECRNGLAHMSSRYADLTREQLDAYIVSEMSLSWALRIILLQEAGIQEDVLQLRHFNYQPYQFFLANAAQYSSLWIPSD